MQDGGNSGQTVEPLAALGDRAGQSRGGCKEAQPQDASKPQSHLTRRQLLMTQEHCLHPEVTISHLFTFHLIINN